MRGVGIGDPIKRVTELYPRLSCDDEGGPGSPGEPGESGNWILGSIYGGVIFDYERGAVTRIFVGAGAE